ncbi:MAG: dihydropyrimidinase, partial [Gammaproteobacteria bacterium]
FHVIVTDLNEAVLEEIASLPAMGVTSIKMFMAYKGVLQVDDDTLFKAFEKCREVGVLPMVHAENGCAIDVLVKQELAAGNTEPVYHALSRPPRLEAEATGRAIALAEVAKAPLFIVHMSCEESLEQLQAAKERGSLVFGETCTHYMFFTLKDLDRPDFEGAKWVCSPPFRETKDHDQLWKALKSGLLSVVSTDHCAFRFDGQKSLGRDDFSKIPNGVPGIEERMMVMHHNAVNECRFDLNRLVALTATNPAKLFGLDGKKGSVAVGYDADLVLWDFDGENVLSVDNLHSAVDYTLYEGHFVRGVPEKVWVRGRQLVDGKQFLGEPGFGEYQPRRTFEVTGL